jgi:hypothetical protein
MSDELRDWPEPLKRNAAICHLAKAIFKARGECYGTSTVLTEEPPHIRAYYITRADELLQTVQPKLAMAKVAAVKVPDPLFNLAASLARVAFVTGMRTPESNLIGAIGRKDGE